MVYASWIFQITAFLIGCTTLLTQLSLIRELALIFTGNELFLGITLAYWVGGVGFGAGWFPKNIFPTLWYAQTKTLILLTCGSAVLFPVCLLLTRAGFQVLGAQGLEPGFDMLFFIPALVIFPPSILNGLWYKVLLTTAEKTYSQSAEKHIFSAGRFFASEAFGACLAGVGYTFFLSYFWNAFQVAGIVLLVLSAHALLALPRLYKHHTKNIWHFTGKVLLGCLPALLLITGFWKSADDFSKSWYPFPHLQLLNQHTARGHIALVKQNKTYSYYASGKLLYSFPNARNNEINVLLPLLLVPQAKTIALVSNNPEMLRIFSNIDQIKKIDVFLEDQKAHEQFIAVLPPLWNKIFQNHKINIVYGDLRQHLPKQSTRYDIILLTLAPPDTLAGNRHYTLECMRILKSTLSYSGVLLYNLDFSHNRLNQAELNLLRSLKNTCDSIFPYTRLIPLQRLYLCASSHTNLSEITGQRMQRHFSQWHTDQLHYRSEQFPTLFDQAREETLRQQLFSSHTAPLNTDQHPVSSGLQALHWLFKNSSLFSFIIFIALGYALFLSWRFLTRTSFSAAALFFACLGAVIMTLQVSIITAFQAAQGTLWQSIGILFACMMAGLAMGGMLGTFIKNSFSFRIILVVTLALSCILGAGIVLAWPRFLAGAGILLLSGGLLGGLLYALITQQLSAKFAAQGWAADLIGSCWGALFTGTVLIPALGPLAGIVAAVALIVAVIFFRST